MCCTSVSLLHTRPEKKMCVGTKIYSTACIYRLNNKTGDALFTHYSCQVELSHTEIYRQRQKVNRNSITPPKQISAVYLTFLHTHINIYNIQIGHTGDRIEPTNREKKDHFSQYKTTTIQILSESCHAPFVISINFIMFVITSKISDKTFSCAYTRCICICIYATLASKIIQCAQHCVMASHQIVTSVFGVVVVVAVVVLQLHTLSMPQHYLISTEKINIKRIKSQKGKNKKND